MCSRRLVALLFLTLHYTSQASQAGEHMSRRAASIEPEDGECTPSPNAVQQAQNAARQHAMAPPPVMQALPPPPPAAITRPDNRHQVKVLAPSLLASCAHQLCPCVRAEMFCICSPVLTGLVCQPCVWFT